MGRRVFQRFFGFHRPAPVHPPVVRERHMIFVVRPKPVEQGKESAKASAKASAQASEAHEKVEGHGLFPMMSGIPSQLLSMASSMLSGLHGIFHFQPMINPTKPTEEQEAKELKPADENAAKDDVVIAAPHKTMKIEDAGILNEAIENAVRGRQREKQEVESEVQRETSASASIQSDDDDETDPFVI